MVLFSGWLVGEVVNIVLNFVFNRTSMIQEVEKVSVEETTESEITKATLMDHLRERNVSSTPVKTMKIHENSMNLKSMNLFSLVLLSIAAQHELKSGESQRIAQLAFRLEAQNYVICCKSKSIFASASQSNCLSAAPT